MAGLQNKVVLVSGASSGIGAAVAQEFSKYDVRLALTARNEAKLKMTIEKCKANGLPDDKIFYVLGDLTKEDEVNNIVESTVRHYGKLDVLCNIGGELRTLCFYNCSLKAFRDHIDWLVMTFFMMCKAAMPHLYDSKGVCLNIGSLSALRPCGDRLHTSESDVYRRQILKYKDGPRTERYNTLFPYSVCKATTDQMTKCLALEAAPKGVRVCSIDPGTVWNTNIWKVSGICPTEERHKAHKSKSEPMYPLLRVAVAREVAKVFIFLASDDAKFITGVQFPVEGGLSIMSQQMMETNKPMDMSVSRTPME